MASTVYERRAPDPRLVDEALAGSAREVFWLDDVVRPSYPPLQGELDADLTVVGGGYCGLWTAVLAKRRNPGLRVVLLESRRVGWAASGRNGGFCEPSLTHGDENGRARWPRDQVALEQLGQANLAALEDDLVTLSIDAQVERTGTLAVAVERHQVPWLKKPGPGEYLDTAAVHREIASPIFLAGRWSREESLLVHPARLALGLARAAVDLGVEIFEESPATGLEADHGGPVLVRSTRGVVRSAQVALATNAFPALVRRSRRRTVPVYDYVLMTEPLTSAQLSSIGWSNRQGLTDLANQFHYSRLTADNRILYGGYDAIYHPGRRIREEYEDRPESYRRLAAHFLTTFPQLEAVRFSHRWAGVIDTSTQFCAFHGLTKSGRVAYASGFTGLGVAATRFAAEVMLDRLSGTETPRTRPEVVRTLPLPFPPEPLTSAGIAMTRWALDRADHNRGRRNLLLRSLDSVGLGFDS
ncbi:MAG TPA: FAD-dependent oxidoreductase [Pedococcus sp.]|nr:FAD-dependent oxidoreductase [Pedococcus sp.]